MPTTTARTEFLAGIRAELPILLGVAPFGMIYGALAIGAGLPRSAAQAMSSIVFAGSAQFVATQLFATGAPGLVLLLTTFIVNLRHMLYSASLAPHVQKLPARWKWLLAYLLTDEAYAPTILHYRQGEVNHGVTEIDDSLRPPRLRGEILDDASSDKRHWFFLGAGLALWSVWQASTAVGIFVGAQVPPSWALDFTLALTFIALLIPALTDRPSVAAALSAGIIALVGAGWPYKLGLVTAALVGIAVGAWLDRSRTRGSDQALIPGAASEEV
jgi:predicted branched-subunit amino acid permease